MMMMMLMMMILLMMVITIIIIINIALNQLSTIIECLLYIYSHII